MVNIWISKKKLIKLSVNMNLMSFVLRLKYWLVIYVIVRWLLVYYVITIVNKQCIQVYAHYYNSFCGT